MLINISIYFFLLYLFKSHLNSIFGYNDNPSIKFIEPNKLLYDDSVIKNRILKEDNPHCEHWSEWTSCSKTCDVGVKMRVKTSSNKDYFEECSKISETSICLLRKCSESDYEGNEYETKNYEKKKEKKNSILKKYLLIFGIISVVNILLLLICVIVSLKKKII
ncbi:thrombospondin-related sporozoite protein, putative [Plasmodium gallinaceum]|uniref:Thrombospondin-related sporozoite protein, putative n=1 Tax=Plasmodium gallinaceum TaxID=5849 RepID=A0A1J1GLK7_PLAGA|nr:thrombospondin-related sporozoite protein, putative [Plasmodium gallinaceum]CRG93294.1 thrombospondin-related sporozoite protein, putative [Plasmodium gallinaceum]